MSFSTTPFLWHIARVWSWLTYLVRKRFGTALPVRALSSYADIQRTVARLGRVRTGFVRVYRGQTRDYGRMLPTALRSAPRQLITWRNHAAIIARGLAEATKADGSTIDHTDLDRLTFWVEAVVQHYGPGTPFLDVTRSLDVALWFALHSISEREVVDFDSSPLEEVYEFATPDAETRKRELWIAELVQQPGDVIETLPDRIRRRRKVPFRDVIAKYRQSTEAIGYLYVFDVPEWDLNGLPSHGHLVDLARAPQIYADGARIRAQDACLLKADSAVRGGNLWSCLICAPIPVSWPTDGPPLLSAPTETMFPPMECDPWYERLLSIPLVLRQMDPPDPARSRAELGRAMPLTVYLPDEGARAEGRKVPRLFMRPPLVYSAAVTGTLGGSLAMCSDVKDWIATESTALNSSVPIVVESPVLYALPDIETDLWNHDVLCSDLLEELPVFDRETGSVGSLALTNIFFEWSPLETSGWEQLARQGGTLEVLRAMWLLWKGERFAVNLVRQRLTSQMSLFVDIDLLVDGPVLYEFERNSRRLHRRKVVTGEPWGEVDGSASTDKPLFAALSILRMLMPTLKADAFAQPVGNRSEAITVRVRWGNAILKRAQSRVISRPWYVLLEGLESSSSRRFSGDGSTYTQVSNEPFYFGTDGQVGAIDITAQAWPRLEASEIRRRLHAEFGAASSRPHAVSLESDVSEL